MKIQSMNSFLSMGKPQFSKKVSNNQNFSSVNFQGKLNVNELKNYPLEKKLPHLFTNCSFGDIIAVGKNIDEIYKGLSRAIGNFGELISRILFIKHGGLSVPMVFQLGQDEEWEIKNIGNKNIFVMSGGCNEEIEPDGGFILDDGDFILNERVGIPIEINAADMADIEEIEDIDDLKLMMNPENFVTSTYNIDGIQQKWIQKSNEEVLSVFGKQLNKQKPDSNNTKKLSFKDVGGMEKTIETLKRNILYPIKYPYAYQNVQLNKGILLYGKPGTGKTLLAEALAGESNAEFIKLSGTDFESKYYGETEEKWRNLFAEAREKQPSIIFIDEFEAVVKERGRGENNQNNDKTVNQILSLMSDLEKSNDNVFVIATTNKPETIDSAIMRSGRFGKHIEIPEPDRKALKSIYNIHVRNKNVDRNLDTDKLIDTFYSRHLTGADVKYVVNEAHTNSWVRNGIYEKMEAGTLIPKDMAENVIVQEDFDNALEELNKNRFVESRKPIGFN